MSWWASLFGFDGRINRARYWLGILAFYLLIVAALYASIDLVSAAVPVLAACWIHCAVAVKRLHDLDKSGWWAIPCLLLPGGQLILGALAGTEGANRYGADPLSTWHAA